MVNISNVLAPRALANSGAGEEAQAGAAELEQGISGGAARISDVAGLISACFPPIGTEVAEAILNSQPQPSRAHAGSVAGVASGAGTARATLFAALGEAGIGRNSSFHALFATATTEINDPLAVVSACFPPIGTPPAESMLDPQAPPPRVD